MEIYCSGKLEILAIDMIQDQGASFRDRVVSIEHSCRQRNCETPCNEDDDENYQSAYDSVEEIQCPHSQFFECWGWFDRDDIKKHLRMHPDERQDSEHYWQLEAERRFKDGPYWTPYNKANRYAA